MVAGSVITILFGVLQAVTALGVVYLYVRLQRALQYSRETEMELSLRRTVADLLAELEASTERAATGIAEQRTTLAQLLRDADRRIQLLPETDAPLVSGMNPATDPVVATVRRNARMATGWQEVAMRLATEGLSEAAIARQLRVGLDEVRLTLATYTSGNA